MSGSFNLGDYVDVPTRLRWALNKFPDLRIQETHREIIEMPDKSCFIRCVVTIWRDANDPIPVIASACEIYPGRTPYTKMSESEVGYTSALGRGLGYLGAHIDKSIASRNEVEAAQSRQPIGQLAEVRQIHHDDTEVPFSEVPHKVMASDKQLGMMRGMASAQGMDNLGLKQYCSEVLGRTISSSGELSKSDVSKVIDSLKLTAPH